MYTKNPKAWVGIEWHGNRKYDPVSASLHAKADSLKAVAKFRKILWDLDKEFVVELLVQPCAYCGIPPQVPFNSIKNRAVKLRLSEEQIEMATVLINGLDRIDSNKGYINDNVVPCCWMCNAAKNDKTVQVFFDWVRRVCDKNSLHVG